MLQVESYGRHGGCQEWAAELADMNGARAWEANGLRQEGYGHSSEHSHTGAHITKERSLCVPQWHHMPERTQAQQGQ